MSFKNKGELWSFSSSEKCQSCRHLGTTIVYPDDRSIVDVLNSILWSRDVLGLNVPAGPQFAKFMNLKRPIPMMSFIIDVLSLEDANWRASGAVTLWVSCTPRTIGPIVWRPHCRFQMPIFLNLGAQRIPREAWDLN